MTIVGAIIGAGFASGKEILTFFGNGGWLSVAFSALLFGMLFGCIFLFLYCPAENQKQFGKLVFGKASWVLGAVYLFCHFCVLSAMIAGARSLCAKAGVPWLFLVLFCGTGILLLSGFNWVLNANAVLLPGLLVFLVVVPTTILSKNKPALQFPSTSLAPKLLLNLVLYVAMNMLTASPVLLSVKSRCKNKKSCAALASAIVSVLFLLIFLAICGFSAEVELPFFSLCVGSGRVASFVCVVFLLVATLTTLVSCGMALVEPLTKITRFKPIAVFSVLCASAFASIFGFSNIVKYVYPVMGVLGLFIVVILSFKCILSAKMNKKHSIHLKKSSKV